MPLPYELLSPQLQALVAAAGLATCSLMDAAAQSRAERPVEMETGDFAEAAPSVPQRARLLLPPTR